MSAGRTTGQGCRIKMDDEPGESYIEHKESGKRLPLEKKNNVFVLRARVLKHGAERDWVMPMEEGGSGGASSSTAPAPAAPPVPELVIEDEGSEDEETLPAKAAKAGVKPSAEEVARHEVTHFPYRNWCHACQVGRGRDRYHKPTTQRVADADTIIRFLVHGQDT